MSTSGICVDIHFVLLVYAIYTFCSCGCVTELHFNGLTSMNSSLTSEKICQDKGLCVGTKSYPDISCFCDSLCHVMGDCCENIDEILPRDQSFFNMEKSQFICDPDWRLTQDMAIGNGVLKVSKCKSDWNDTAIKTLCEGDVIHLDKNSDVILQIPVSDSNIIMYRNMYCAYCNGVYNFEFWKPEFGCSKDVDVTNVTEVYTNCDVTLRPPRIAVPKRPCPLSLMSECGVIFEPPLLEQCTKGPFLVVYMSDGYITTSYRNQYCAVCNGINVTILSCEPDEIPKFGPRGRPPPYSLRLLVDFNTGSKYVNGVRKSHDTMCGDNQFYDVLFNRCRDTLSSITCTFPAIAKGGRCVEANVGDHNVNHPTTTRVCTWVRFDEHEYVIINSSSVYIHESQTVYGYKINSSDVFVCLDDNQTCILGCNKPEEMFNFGEAESLVSFLGLVISIVSLTITFVIYVSFSQQLLNMPGKNLLCLVISLWSAQFLFLASAAVEEIPALCVVFAIAIHYFFLAAFCWMNVIAVDLSLTFSNTTRSSNTAKRLIIYHVYSWFVPVLIVGVAMLLDFTNFHVALSHFKPRYGDSVCWISSRDALLLFFIGPLALFKLVDVVCFIFTAYHIARARRQGAMARQNNNNTWSLLINIKLSLVMGLTWVFAFVANVTNTPAIWYMFILFNTLQGLFIALSFLCTKKVGRLLSERFIVVSSYLSSRTGTQSTDVHAVQL